MLQEAAQEGGFWTWGPPGSNCKGANPASLLQCADFCPCEEACHWFLISPDYGPAFDIIDLRPLKYHLSSRFDSVIRARQLRPQSAPSSLGARGAALLNSGLANLCEPYLRLSFHPQTRWLSPDALFSHLAFHVLPQKSSGLQQISSALSSLADQGASSVHCFSFHFHYPLLRRMRWRHRHYGMC